MLFWAGCVFRVLFKAEREIQVWHRIALSMVRLGTWSILFLGFGGDSSRLMIITGPRQLHIIAQAVAGPSLKMNAKLVL